MSSEGLGKAGPQLLIVNDPPWLCCEAVLELWRRRSHQEAVVGVQREMMAAWTRLLAVGFKRSGSFKNIRI